MRNFQLIAQQQDILPLLHAVQRQPELWNTETLRTTHPGTPHSQVDDILLRFNDLAPLKAAMAAGRPQEEIASLVMDQHESINFPAMWALPQARPIIFGLMQRVEGERLGRVLITRLAPGKTITPHVDGGEHAAYYDRYHVLLNSRPGAIFKAGNEAVQMFTGQVWWFDNAQEHSVVNNSDDDRITMIVDIRTSR